MISVPVSTHVVESAVVNSSISKVWAVLSKMDMKWWKLVASSELVGGASHQTLDATIKLNFVDSQKWTIQLREISSISKSVTFEVIVCEPGKNTFFSFTISHHSYRRI